MLGAGRPAPYFAHLLDAKAHQFSRKSAKLKSLTLPERWQADRKWAEIGRE
jgi:hypothetical protein